MPPLSRLLPLLAVTAIALLVAHGAAALSLESPRSLSSRHRDIALSKRDVSSRRCKERFNSSEGHPHSTGTHKSTTYSNSNNDAASAKVGLAYPLSTYDALKAFKTSHVS